MFTIEFGKNKTWRGACYLYLMHFPEVSMNLKVSHGLLEKLKWKKLAAWLSLKKINNICVLCAHLM